MLFIPCTAFLALGIFGHCLHNDQFSDSIGELIAMNETPEVTKPLTVADMIVAAAVANNVPVRFAMAVARQESGLDPTKRGKIGEIGLFQLRCSRAQGKPGTAQLLGFAGRCDELYDPATNAYWGTMHLKAALVITGGNLCQAATLHNRGLAAHPTCSTYGEQVLAKL